MAKQKKEIKNTFLSTGAYYADLYDEQTLHAVLIRSPISSGTIRSINLPSIPENCFIFTADDLPKKELITILSTTFPIFAKEKISYKGEPIGIVIGPELSVLYDLLQTVDIVFTEAFSKTPLETDGTNQRIIAQKKVSYGGTKVIKETATQTIENHYALHLDIEETSETNGALCYAGAKNLVVYTPTVWPSNLRKNLVTITGYDTEDIIIHKTKLPISEKNAPWKNTTLAIQCAIASMLCKKSVLLSLSHDEQNLYDNCYSKVDIFHSTRVSNSGKILSAEVKINLDVGAYNPFTSIIVDRLTIASVGAYAPSKLSIEVTAVTSERPPTTSDIRWLDYHCFFAIENQVEQIALATNIDPAALRTQNIFLQSKKYPFQIDTSLYKNVLDIAIQKSDFYRKYEAYKLNPYTKKSKTEYFPIRGIGLATAYEANGFLGAMIDTGQQSLEVTIEKNGKVRIKVLSTSLTLTAIWKEVAASILSVNVEDITIDNFLSQNEEPLVPEKMVSNMYITSQLLKKACLSLQKQRFHQPLPITVKRTFNLANKKTWNTTNFTGKPFYVTSWIALVAEIELNMPIYSYDIRSIWISIDAGSVMNKRKARYAIQSCVKKVLSQALKNQQYSQPDISVTFLESGDDPKQIRELVYSTLPSAISNALSQTLRQALTMYPVEQERIFELFQGINEQIDKKNTEEAVSANKPNNK